jgi:hypothetical protein
MTYVEYMRRLGVSVEPEVKAEVEPVVETVSLTPDLQRSLDRFMSGLPSKTVEQLNAHRLTQQSKQRSYESIGNYQEFVEYYRLTVIAIDDELASRVVVINPLSAELTASLATYVRGLPRRDITTLLGSQRAFSGYILRVTSPGYLEYYRRALAAVEAELASRERT